MTVLSVVQNAATQIAMDVPSQVFGNPSRDMVEMRALLNEVARQIADEAEWSILLKTHTITGDGATEDFALPSDFRRMVKDARLWSSVVTTTPLTHILSVDKWLGMDTQDFTILYGAWIVYGGEMHIKPARATGETVKFFYQSCNLVKPDTGPAKKEFTADDDTFILPERLLTLGVVWNWKQRKGLDYAEPLSLYQDALAQAIGADKGPGIIKVGQARSRLDARCAHPFGLG